MATEKTFEEKLAILVHHWLHHNEEHCAEFDKWRQEAAAQGMVQILPQMDACLEAMQQVNQRFAALMNMTMGKEH